MVRGTEVLLISTRAGRRWGLPKGRLEAGETPEMAALREIQEETGIIGRITAPLLTVQYTFWGGPSKRIKKRVDYYLLDYESGSEANFDPEEVSAAVWMPWDEALARLTFENDKNVIRAAQAVIAGEPPPTPDD